MKRLILFLLPLWMMACIPSNNEDVLSLNLSESMIEMKVGEYNTTLTASVTPASAIVTWTSSDESIVTVDDGILEGKAMGMATITAKAGSKIATCDVYVSSEDGRQITLNTYLVELQKGDTFTFICRNVYGLPVEWSSSDESVVTINSDGVVTARKGGVAIIKATTSVAEDQAVVAVKRHWGNYTLVWEENFDGNSLDESVWNYETGTGNGGWGNQEKQYYTAREKNIRVKDGNLQIQAYKEDYNGSAYTSARIQTKGKKSFKYGKMEARIKFPAGGGTWPAFWMLGSNGAWPACGEIDIVEYVGNIPKRASFALHSSARHGGSPITKVTYFDNNLYEDFHTYGVIWEEEEDIGRDVIKFTVDDVVYFTVTENATYLNSTYYWPYQQYYYFILNLAIGGNMGGAIDDAIFNNDVIMYVDWVRVYQRSEIE